LPRSNRVGSLESINLPEKPVQRDAISHLCQTWRNRLDLQDAYAEAAIALESEHGIASLTMPPAAIEELDTFAALDRLLLMDAAAAMLAGDPTIAGKRATRRRATFWNRRTPETLLQWSLLETAADLLGEASLIGAAVAKRKWTLDELISAYVAHAKP